MKKEPQVFPESARLKFRAWEEADWPFFAAMNASPLVMRFFPSVLTEEESRSMWDRMRAELDEKGYGLYAVELNSSGALIGGSLGLWLCHGRSRGVPGIRILLPGL